MIRTRIVLAAATIACWVLPCFSLGGESRESEGSSKPVVLARVNGDEVTGDELLAEFSERHAGHAKFLGGQAEARRFLKTVIENRLLVQEAYAIGLDEHPEATAAISQHVSSLSSNLLIVRELKEKSEPTQEEVRRIWEKDLDFVFRVREIAVDRVEEARAIRAAIMSGADAEILARACSIADSRLSGGNLMLAWGDTTPEIEEAVFSLDAGELSPVIETREGYQVILVIDRIMVPRPEFADASSRIEGILRSRKLDQRKAEFSNELWKRYRVAIPSLDFSPGGLLPMLLHAPATVVATWEGGQLVLGQLAEPEELRAWASLPPRRAAVEVEKRLRATVNASLVDLEARRRGIPDEPDLVKKTEDFTDLVVTSLLFRDHIFRGLTVTEAEAKTYFEEHRKEFSQDEERHVAHIMVRSEDDAKRVRQELKVETDFGDAAKQYSRDFASALFGGDLGWITAAKVPSSFEAILSLEEGEVSAPLKSDRGWHLVKVLEIRPERFLNYEEVQDKLEQSVLGTKKSEARQYWIDKLRAAAEIEIVDDAIAQFVRENEMESFDAPSPGHEIPAGAMKPH